MAKRKLESEQTAEPMLTDDASLSEADRAVITEGSYAYNVSDNPYGAGKERADDRSALLWRKGFCDGLRADGAKDFRDGTLIDNCPYDEEEDSTYADCWREGWLAEQANSRSTETHTTAGPFIDELCRLESECAEAEREYEALKKEATDAKKAFELKVAHLRRAVRAARQPMPLFEQPASPPDSTADTNATSQTNELWKTCGIDRLGLAAKLQEKLIEAEVYTIGDLENLRGGKGLRSIKGIGDASVDKIEDAVIDWLSKNRDTDAIEQAV